MAGTFEWYLVRTQYISNLKWSILPSRFLFVYSSNTNCCIHIPRYLYFCEIKVYFEVEFISNWAWAFAFTEKIGSIVAGGEEDKKSTYYNAFSSSHSF